MPTLPPEPQQFSPSESHHARQIAESFGSEAERYERTRPTYPNAMVDAILVASPGRDVLDVGIGTGISARPFQQEGCQVLGVDPDERMAEYARQSGLEVEIAKFEEWDPAGRTFDVVIAGQTWHWVDPVLGASKAAEILQPGGRIALFWNVMSFPPDFAKGCSAVYQRVLPEFPFFQGGAPGGAASYAPLTDKAIDGIKKTGMFSEPEQWQFDWERPYTRDEWLEIVPTFGGHSQIPPEKLAELLSAIGDVVDAAGGHFIMGYASVVVTAASRCWLIPPHITSRSATQTMGTPARWKERRNDGSGRGWLLSADRRLGRGGEPRPTANHLERSVRRSWNDPVSGALLSES